MRKKTVLITGGAKRIGRAIVEKFAAEGWKVIIHANHSLDDARRLQEQLPGQDANHCIVAGDLADIHTAQRLMTEIFANHGTLDALINNASMCIEGAITEVTAETLLENTTVNYLSPLMLIVELYKKLGENDRASVVNLTDRKIANLNRDCWAYTTSKLALHGSLDFLAMSIAKKLRIAEIAPGPTLPHSNQSEEPFTNTHKRTTLGKRSTPEVIAQYVYLVAVSDYLSGQRLIIDGGQHLLPSAQEAMFMSGASFES